MPATARKNVFVPEEVGVYHTMSRIVARRYLMGVDESTGTDFSHRKAWIETRIRQLAQVFAIDPLSFAVLDNHFHHQVRVRPDLAKELSDEEVVRRSLQISPRYMTDSVDLEEPEMEKVLALVDDEEYVSRARERLSDISWYMKCLKEPLSRRANAEELVSGCFWEGRFKMSRMLDEPGVLLCAAYIDLNEVRAGVAETPEESMHSSIGRRIEAWSEHASTDGGVSVDGATVDRVDQLVNPEPAPEWLTPIDERNPNGTHSGTLTEERPKPGQKRPSNSGFLSCSLDQYLSLCDTLGRMFRSDKRSKIADDLPKIAERLFGNQDALRKALTKFMTVFPRVCGSPESMKKEADRRGLRSVRGISTARQLLSLA